MPQQDEALKSLVSKFEAAPGSRAFVELSAALLARGHASESLRVAEHGLQLVPDSVEGRVERAAALLALGRPRVAYVELVRALAIHPGHKRGMRLLGRTFRDSGAPGRAAQLLAKRAKMESEGSSTVDANPPEPETWKSRPGIDDTPADHVPALFSALTKDLGLGLGAAVPNRKARPRVEVTQIMRRKQAPRPPRSASELAEIVGPIVDNTQPGTLEDQNLSDEPPQLTTKEPAPLWQATPPGITDFGLDDEPLFQEDMPFKVAPVPGQSAGTGPAAGPAPAASIDTVVDKIEATDAPLEKLDSAAAPMSLFDIPDLPEETAPMRPSTSDLSISSPDAGSPAAQKQSPGAEAQTRRSPMPDAVKAQPQGQVAEPRGATNIIPGLDTVPVAPVKPEPAGALVEKGVRKEVGLQIMTPAIPKPRIMLAAGAALAMLVYVIGMLWVSQDSVSVWFGEAPKTSAAAEPPVDAQDAQGERP